MELQKDVLLLILPLSRKMVGIYALCRLTLTRKKCTPKVGRLLASLTYRTFASISDVPASLLCSEKMRFSILLERMYDCGRNSLRLNRKEKKTLLLWGGSPLD